MDLSQFNNPDDDPFQIVRPLRRFLEQFAPSPEVDLSKFLSTDLESYVATHSKLEKPVALGDFDRLFKFCGKPVSTPRSPSSVSSISTKGPLTPVPSAPEDVAINFDDFVRRKDSWTDWENGEGSNSLVRIPPGNSLDTDRLVFSDEFRPFLEADNLFSGDERLGSRIGQESLSHGAPVSILDKGKGRARFYSNPSTLLPSSVLSTEHSEVGGPLPSPPFIDPIYYQEPHDPSLVQAHFTLTREEQKAKLVKKLMTRFPHEATLLRSQEIPMLAGGKYDSNGIHVFVDLSNIIIGFCERIKETRRRTGRLTQNARVKLPPFSFQSLALVLERGRPAAYKVMVGSTSHAAKIPSVPSHVREGERLGYQVNILERVMKPQSPVRQKKKGGLGSGYLTTGYTSTSDAQPNRPMKMQEQGVDEILQLKMAMSLLTTKEPSTMVLASGDAAEAEYSGGFLKLVEEALSRGWKVEVAAWKDGLSQEYRSAELLRKWGEKLEIIELDPFAEEMLGIYTEKYVAFSRL